MRRPGPEGAKALLLGLGVPLLILGEGVPVAAAVTLSLAHVGGLAVAGFCLTAIFAVELPRSWADRLTVSYLAGWGTVPVFVLTAYGLGGLGWGLVLTYGALVGAAVWVRRGGDRASPRPGGREVPATIPLGAYVVALGYVVISVGIPFSHFSPGSIARELFIDGVQRFGSAYALAEGIPPMNPFVAGAPLQYYWFFLVPHAAEYRLVHGDLFAVWKCAQTWTAMLLLPGLWSLVHTVFRGRTVAWAALALGFVFASWEIVMSGELVRALAGGPDGMASWARPGRLLSAMFTGDPDMRIGLITTYSDQLFMEDFVYVPQNAAALIVTLLALWYTHAGRPGVATFTLSTLAGFNTFFALPAYAAFTTMHAMRSGWRASAVVAVALSAYSLVWLRICEVVEAVPLGLALTLGVLAAFLLRAAGPGGAPDLSADEPRAARWLRPAAWAGLVALALVVTLRPGRNAAALLLNYGPGFVLGLACMARLALRGMPVPAGARSGLLFLLVAGAASALTSWLLSLDFVDAAPAPLRRLSAALGLVVNLFNFHHKTWKLSRLGWAILAGLLLEGVGRRWRARLTARPVLAVLTGALLATAVLTSLVRPFTYLGSGPVHEQAAAAYLQRHGKGLDTRVLLEDFRGARLSMLVPVSAFYFSPWSGGNPGLTHQVGTWADQYLPGRARPESTRREALVQRFFAPDATLEERARIVREERINYILAQSPRDLAPLATLVTTESGSYLYRVQADPGG